MHDIPLLLEHSRKISSTFCNNGFSSLSKVFFFLLHPFLPLSGYGSVVPPLTPTAVAASLGAFFFLLLFTLFEALKVFSPQRWRHCHLLSARSVTSVVLMERPASPHSSVNKGSRLPQEPRISPPSRDHSPRDRGAPNGPLQTSSRAVALSNVVPLPSCHLDYRGRRTPSGFSPTFTGSWHLAEGGFEPGTMD